MGNAQKPWQAMYNLSNANKCDFSNADKCDFSSA